MCTVMLERWLTGKACGVSNEVLSLALQHPRKKSGVGICNPVLGLHPAVSKIKWKAIKKDSECSPLVFVHRHTCAHTHITSYIYINILRSQKRSLDPIELCVLWGAKYGCWELNSVPLQEQYMLLSPSYLCRPTTSC